MSATGYLGLQMLTIGLSFQLTEPKTIESFFCMLAILLFGLCGMVQIGRGKTF